MDPFTEKLLARTQARKAALAKKREEVASRSPVVTPRRPLAEKNPKTPGEVVAPTKEQPTVMSPSVVVKTTETVAPKTVVFEKVAKQVSLQQKECFNELGEAKNTLKPTPKKREVMKSGEAGLDRLCSDEPKLKKVLIDEVGKVESPSVKDRTALYMKQVLEDSNTSIKEKTSSSTVKKSFDSHKMFSSLKESRSSLAGGRFFNDPRAVEVEASKSVIKENKTPVKPPRAAVAGKVVKSLLSTTSESNISGEATEKQLCSDQNAPPVKPPRTQNIESKDVMKSKTSSVAINLKRQAPLPPNDFGSVKSPKKATKLPNENECKQPGSSSKDGIIDASNCAFSKSETSQACDVPSISVQPSSPQRCNHDNGDPDANKAKKADDVEMTQSNKDTVALTNDQLIATSDGIVQQHHNIDCNNDDKVSTTDRSTSKKKSEKELTHISSKTNLDLDSSMNPHEITFNISMTEFDQALQEEKNVMFQTTYDESIKKAEQQLENTSRDNEPVADSLDTANPVLSIFKGVKKSCYNSDQYATTVTPKKATLGKTGNSSSHEKVQMLLEEAACQQNIVLQASQAINTCLALHDGQNTGSSEEIEAERLLRFSTERRTACLEEVQKLKSMDKDDTISIKSVDITATTRVSNATLKISKIKIPVDKKILQSENASEQYMHSFICIVKHTPKQMFCTKAVSSSELKNGHIVFDDKFEVKNVKPSFSLTIHVFVLKSHLHASALQNKNRKKSVMGKSVLDSPKIKQIIGNTKKGNDNAFQGMTPGSSPGPVFRTSGFTLASTTEVNLENIYSPHHTMHLTQEKSILNGVLNISVECKPEYTNQARGFLTIFEDVGGLGDWLRYWCVLDGSVLNYWKYPDDDLIKPPLGFIDLGLCVSESVTIVPRDICARPHTMQMILEKPMTATDRESLIAVNADGKMLIKYMLAADTKADKMTWLNTINDSLEDRRAWHSMTNMKQRAQSV